MKGSIRVFGFMGAALLASAAFADDVPVVSNVNLVQQGKKVVVSYDLSEAPAVVTMEVLTNGAPVAESVQGFLSGDVNRYVAAGNGKQITFVPRDCLPPDREFPATTVRVKAWNVEAPPDYMVVDLEHYGVVRYYVSTNALPAGGLTNDLYRKTQLVLRRIPAAGQRWIMGENVRLVERSPGTVQHPVVLSEDYYLGVFETTQYQQKLFTGKGSDSDEETSYADADVLPAHAKRRNLRPYASWWKLDNHEFSTGHLAKFRQATGVKFDLPTEAQWEFACRAGMPGVVNIREIYRTSANWNNDAFWAALNECAWYDRNSGTAIDVGTRSHRVGEKQPNAFGLYDMHGNLAEWVLDYKGAPSASYDLDCELDPPGASTPELVDGSADNPVFPLRGGFFGYNYFGYQIQSGSRSDGGSWKSDQCGYRLCAPVTAVASGN